MKNRVLLHLTAIILPLMLGIGLLMDLAGLSSRSRDLSLDIYTRLQPFEGNQDILEKLIFVDVDEASLAAFGQWPWPRHYMAVLLQNIGLQEPRVIGFDILFSEADRFNPAAIEALGGLPEGSLSDAIPDGDGNFGAMLELTPSVVALALSNETGSQTSYLPAGVSVIGEGRPILLEAAHLLSPVEALQTAPGAGFVSLSLERDSVVRYAPMIARYDDRLIPSFSAEMLRVAQGARGHILKQSGETGEAVNQLRTGRIISKLDEFGRLPLYLGHADRFTTISAADILQGENLEALADAFIIIGSSATGLKDIQSTALDAAIPGPIIHLHILHQILSEVTLSSSAITELAEIILSVIAAMILALICIRLAVAPSIIAVLASASVAACLSYYGFTLQMTLTNAVANGGLILLTGITVMFLRALAEETNRRQLRAAFGQYLSPTMVKSIEQSGQKPELGGITTDISVFFLDIRGFTSLSETLADKPQTLTRIINFMLDHCTQIILKHGGTLDKYIGDAIMAFWNAPLEQADHARRAVDAAIEIENSLPELNRQLDQLMGEDCLEAPLSIGIGIATGPAVVGNFGSRQRLSYSVLGDTVNLAARLEPVVKQTGVAITLADQTARQAAHPDIVSLTAFTVRGRQESEPIHGYLPLSEDIATIHHALAQAASQQDKDACQAIVNTHGERLANTAYPQRLLDFYRNL